MIGDPSPMSLAVAEAINATMVRAWMLRQGLVTGPVPSLAGVTLDMAMRASALIAEAPGVPTASGGRVFSSFVSPRQVPMLYAWACVHSGCRTG